MILLPENNVPLYLSLFATQELSPPQKPSMSNSAPAGLLKSAMLKPDKSQGNSVQLTLSNSAEMLLTRSQSNSVFRFLKNSAHRWSSAMLSSNAARWSNALKARSAPQNSNVPPIHLLLLTPQPLKSAMMLLNR